MQLIKVEIKNGIHNNWTIYPDLLILIFSLPGLAELNHYVFILRFRNLI